MPESKGRKAAEIKKKQAHKAEAAQERAERQRLGAGLADNRAWVPPTFITVGLLGVLWLVVWYLTTAAGVPVPGMADIGAWNLLIGMGLMAIAFGISTLWK